MRHTKQADLEAHILMCLTVEAKKHTRQTSNSSQTPLHKSHTKEAVHFVNKQKSKHKESKCMHAAKGWQQQDFISKNDANQRQHTSNVEKSQQEHGEQSKSGHIKKRAHDKSIQAHMPAM